MNTKTLGSLTIAALLLAACSNEEWPETVATKCVLKATVEGSHSGTRAGFDNSGAFFWSNVDAIGVTTTGDLSKFTSLNLTTGGGTANATFEGTITTGEIGKYAIYPNNSGHSIDANNNLVYNFPTEYTYDKVDTDFFVTQGEGNSFNPAMFGEIKEGNVKLNHLGGVICIKIPEMPVAEGKLTLTADKRITGTFDVPLSGNLNGKMACLAGEGTATSENTVTINFSGATANTSGVFYVPVPVGTYSLTIKVYGKDKTNPTTNFVAGEYTINRCDLKKIDLGAIKNENGLKKVAAEGGEYTLTADVRGDFVISATERVTINLNDHTITNKTGDTFTINMGSELYINGNGTVDNISPAKACIYNNGNVILNGGTYTRSKEKEDSSTNSGNNILNHGTMQIEPGVTVEQAGHSSTMIANGYSAYGDKGESRNGYVSGTNHENPSLTINGGTFTGGGFTIKNDDNGTLNITNGTFTNNSQTNIQNHHVATISGGVFNGSECSDYVIDNCACGAKYDQGIMTISGGTITGKVRYLIDGVENSIMSITGGTFSDPNVLQYLGENANVTVELVKDIELTTGKGIVMDKYATAAATVKLNGFTIKNSTETAETTPTSQVFCVEKGTLTIEGEGNVQSIASESSTREGSRTVVTADGEGIVNIKGGNYYNKQNVDGKLNLILARGNGKINISGGTFESGNYSEPGKYWVLDKPNGSTGSCAISVTGGKFINFNPAHPFDDESFLADGYSAYLNGVITEDAYQQTDKPITYEVKPTVNQ